MLTKFFWRLRYAVLIASLFAFVGAAAMLYVGAKKTCVAIWSYLQDELPEVMPAYLNAEDVLIIGIIQSVDAFLIAFALGVFGYGIYGLVEEKKAVGMGMPRWVVPQNIGHLKETLAHVIIIILFVLFVRIIWFHLDDLSWDLLVLPASIALLALSLKLIKFTGGHAEKRDDSDTP